MSATSTHPTDWLSAKLMVKMYLCFNGFVMVLQLLDSILHILVLLSLFHSRTFIPCAALSLSFATSQIFKAICFNVSKYKSSDLNILLAPFGNILYLFKYKKHLTSLFEYLRIYQLYLEYTRILNVYYYNNKIIQINNISLFANCYIKHYGNSLFDCFLHELFESLPNFIVLFFTIIYYQEYNNNLYNLSIMLSFFCIIFSLFTWICSKYHMHRSILFTIYILIIINLLMFSSILSFITCQYQCRHYNYISITNINHFYYLKYKYLTLPLSTSICILYILRKISFAYHNNRPNQSIKQFLFCVMYLIISILLYFILFIISSIIFDIFLNTIWLAFVIHRIYNQRFYNINDDNNRFWRLIIQFIVTNNSNLDQMFEKLFAVNSVFLSKQQFFPNQKLAQWMNKEYINVYYGNDMDGKGSKSKKFTKFCAKNNHFQNGIFPIFQMVFMDEIFIYYFSDNDTLTNIRQFFYDFVNGINFCGVIHDNNINLFSQIIYFCVYYFTIYIGVTLYILSRIITFFFPMVYILNMRYYYNLSLLPIMFSYLYFIFIFLFFIIYFKSFKKIIKIIWYLSPGYYKKNQMYLKKIENYYKNDDLQQYVYKCILWYYNSHKNAPLIAECLIKRFGIDISSVIVTYLPLSYTQEKQIEC